MTSTLPTSPFPELHALDEKRKVPSLADLLSGELKLPVTPVPVATRSTRPPLQLSRMPHNGDATPAKAPRPTVLAEMPVAPADKSMPEAVSDLMGDEIEPIPELPTTPLPAAGSSAPERKPKPVDRPRGGTRRRKERSTDEELAEALLPMLETTLSKALYAPETGLHTYLEPMLRSTVRRAIAEQLESSRQFGEIGPLDRLAWRLSALFTSRTYDEIVFDRTRRYQVEEAYLLRKKSRSLISYASHDPARHASPRRVQSTVRMLVSKLKGIDDDVPSSLDLPERRIALVRIGRHSLLVAILRGTSNALVRADLDYVLRQAEERFGSRLAEESEVFIHVLQPILEGCLLIQAPSPPR